MRGSWTALLGVLFLSPALGATEASSSPAQTTYDAVRDLEIQVRARRLLQQDKDLAALNLGVTVRNGTASVWGPVTSP